MSELIFSRQIEDVTQDIRRETSQFLISAIRIGRLLYEAKAMVPPGGWMKYVEEELPFSHSWANNYMKLYKEYGSDQISLFSDPQTFARLRPTQALELLALPAAKRQEFVEVNDVESMSTRELRQKIRELEDTRQELENARQENETLKDAAEEKTRRFEEARRDDERKLEAFRTRAETAEQAKSRAEKSETNALIQVDRYKKELEEARAREEAIQADLRDARENPDIPDNVMERLRAEAEASAARKATEELEKKLLSAQTDAENAARDRDQAEEAARKATEERDRMEQKLLQAQSAARFADPDMAVFRMLFEQVQNDFLRLGEVYRKIADANPESGEKLRLAIGKLLDTLREVL